MQSRTVWTLLGIALVAVVGCGQGKAPVPVPAIDAAGDAPSLAGDGDANGDGCEILFIDFPCSKGFECLGNTTFRKNTTLSCQDLGYDPKCCSGAMCQQGGVQECPANMLCVKQWNSGACVAKNCGGPGGASCPAGEFCMLPAGVCDPSVAMGVCMSDSVAVDLPPCVTCESDCETTHCEEGKIAQCLEVGGCLKTKLITCPEGKLCAGEGQCLPPTTSLQAMPCSPDDLCSNGSQCLAAASDSSGLCSKPCGTCSGGSCQPVSNACSGFGPGADGACVGPFAIGGQQVPVCAMACTAKGQCPAGLTCKTVPTPFGGAPFAACLTPGL